MPSTASDRSDGTGRKRVGKACDRCRLKKSKCDGNIPCGRCNADNWPCCFGQRKFSHDRVYPKGYVELLELTHQKLVAGLRALYNMSEHTEVWPGEALGRFKDGEPRTHDILNRLDLLEIDPETGLPEHFEDNLSAMQARLSDNNTSQIKKESRDSLSPERSNQSSRVSSSESPQPLHTPLPTEMLCSESFFQPTLEQSGMSKTQDMAAGQLYPTAAAMSPSNDTLLGLDQFSFPMDYGNPEPWGSIAPSQLDWNSFGGPGNIYGREVTNQLCSESC